MNLTDYIGTHPYIGGAVSIGNVLGGVMLQVRQPELPLIVMQLFQIGAWTAAIGAGVFTMYGVYKTHHSKKRK